MDTQRTWLGNLPIDWAYALGLGLLTFVALLVVRRLVTRRARQYAGGTELPTGVRLVSTLVAKTQIFPLLALSLIVGSKYLDLGERAGKLTTAVIVVMVALQVGIWATTVVRFWLEEKRLHSQDRNSRTMVTIVQFVANVVIWALVLLLALDNVGVQVGALLAGLGIGGIAVALAVQNVLGDLLASVSIALDKPFEEGDFLSLEGGFMGTVEAIGIKSTRLRALSGEQIVMPNSEVVKARIRNFGRMQERRAVFTFGVTYGTPRERLAEIPSIVKAAVQAQDDTRFDRCHLLAFGPSSLDYEVVYFVTKPDFNRYADIQQAIVLKLVEEFAAREVHFAFPTQTLVLERAGKPPVHATSK
ncbi:MAG: mechanosensitive ion channel family protein [Steroidobacteraceae bacterium]|jgi:small-conductance mechanosensitive channel|nr:mechanosensitive ion channel family protein [Steroidobacteraceae bacterium]